MKEVILLLQADMDIQAAFNRAQRALGKQRAEHALWVFRKLGL